MARDRTFSPHKVTIPNAGTVSGVIPVGAESIAAIVCPAAWTAAVLAFEFSADDGATWNQVFDDGGTEVSVASAQIVASHVLVNATILTKLQGLSGKVRLASGPAGARVAQGAARDFIVYCKTL